MTPDYTYGHTVTKSMQDITKDAGWTTVTNQVSPLGAPDFSSYLLNVVNSGADILINVNWGHDAVLSIQQAKQFGVLDKMKLVVPYQVPFLARETGGLMQGVYAATDYWWTLEDKFPLAKMFNAAFEKKYGYKPEWGAENAYISFLHWARMVEEAGSFYPPDVIKAYEKEETIPSLVGDVHYRKEDHQCVRPVIIVKGKHAKGHEGQGRLLRHRRSRRRQGSDAEARRVRLQSRRLHLRSIGLGGAAGGIAARGASSFACSRACSQSRTRATGFMINWANFVSQVFNGLALGALAGADQLGTDHHLRHARRAEPRAWRDVHAWRLCRLCRIQLYRVVHRRSDRRLAVRGRSSAS